MPFSLDLWYNNIYILAYPLFPIQRHGNRSSRGGFMDIRVGDVLLMKKNHPCGSQRFQVLRIGMDFRIRCMGCGREVMVPRAKCEKNIKSVIRESLED